jgi:PAS domain S-box-containing protein
MPFNQKPDRNRDLFRHLFEEASLGIAVEDINGTILHANPALCSLLGFSQDELRGMCCSEFAHAEDSQDDSALFQKVRAGQIDRYSLDKRYTRRDGRQIYGHLNVSLVKAGDGGDPIVFAFVEDVTERKTAEREIALTNDRLLLAMEAGGAGGWDWDIKSGKNQWFGKAAELVGVEPDKYGGTTQEFWDRVHPDDSPRLRDAMEKARRDHTEFTEEFRVMWPDGTVRWLRSRGKYFYAPNGEAERMLGISVDVTERRKADEALRKSEAKFSTVFRQSPMALALSRLSDRRYLEVNPTFEQMTGWSRDELIGRTTLDLGIWVRPAQRDELVSSLLAGHAVRDIEIRYRRKDGTERVGAGAADLVEIGDEQCVLSVIADITDRKAAEEARRESEERLRLAVQAGGMYANEWNPATDGVVRSPEYAGILGPDEPMKTTRQMVLDKIHPDDRAKFLAAISELTPENPINNVTYRMLLAGGKVVWLRNTGRAFFDAEGRLLRIIGMAADVTDQKAAEEALSDVSRKLVQAQEQERTRIARDLHDDIAQRLALCVVGLEQLQQRAPEKEAEFSSGLGELRKQLRDIADDVQAISRELHSSKLEYLGLVAALRSLCKEFSERYKVEIRFESQNIPDSIPPQSSLSLFRVLQEALQNAAKHSKSKFFDVKLWRSSEEIHLTVEDRGVGFDIDAAMKGRGLGLTSMRERLRLVNGELSIDSQAKRGTTVHARVPFTLASERAAG